MDIDAETSAEIFHRPDLVRMVLSVSNPASSSYIKFWNLTSEILRLAVVMERGLPRTSDPGPSPPGALGNHDIAPGGHYDVAFHIPNGEETDRNVWSTRFGLAPTASGSAVPSLNLRVMLINGPASTGGGPGDNWATVQVETL